MNNNYNNTDTLTLSINNDEFIADLELDLSTQTATQKTDQNSEICAVVNKVKICEHNLEAENKKYLNCNFCNQKLDVAKLPNLTKFHCPACNKTITITLDFANFTLLEIIGIGGMAVVYKAFDNDLKRNVAIKILNESLITKENHKLLFLKEAQMAARLNHSSIMPIFAFNKHEKKYYIVMPFMDQGSLKSKIYKKQFSQAEKMVHYKKILHWMLEITEGLVYSLRHGIVHHDIKPGNILLDKYENAHLCDFGLAQFFKSVSHNNLSPQFWLSPHYTSPEKVMYRREDYRGDIYSLGATFYHLLAGSPPFHSNNIDGLITARFEQNPKNIRHYNKTVSRKIAKLISQMLNIQPNNRPEYSEIILVLSQELI